MKTQPKCKNSGFSPLSYVVLVGFVRGIWRYGTALLIIIMRELVLAWEMGTRSKIEKEERVVRG